MTSPLATAFVLIRPTTTGFAPALKRDLEGASAGAAAAGEKTGKSWTTGFQKSGVTKAANRISEGLIAAGAASVYMAVKFQSAMEKLHTQAQVSQKQIAGLGDGVLKLAGQVGASPDSLALALYHVESAFQSVGITGKKALSLVKIAAEGAAVGGADLEDVTNALTAVMASGIKGTHGMAGAMGILNAIVGAGDMKMQDLATAMGTGFLAVIKGFGVSIVDAGAALATFGDNNIRGAKAGTQLRMTVQALAAPTSAGAKELISLGIASGSLAKDMQKGGLKLAINDLAEKLKAAGYTSKQTGAILTETFGKRAGVGIQILLDQLGRFNSKFPDITRGASNFGEAWKRTQATASQQMKELGHGLEALGVRIGEKLLPPLMSVFGFIRTHTTLVLTLAGVIGALALAISAVSLGIKIYEAAVGVATAVQWLWNAAMDANPIGLVIIAIGALVIGIMLLWKHCAWFRTAVLDVWHAVKIGFDAVWGGLKTAFAWVQIHWKLLAAILFGPFGLAIDAITTHWKAVSHALGDFWNWLKTQWQIAYEFIIHPIALAAEFIFNTWKTILTKTADMIVSIRNFFAPAVHWLFDAGRNVIEGLFGGMWRATAATAAWVARIGSSILNAVKSFFGIHSPSSVFFGLGSNLMTGLFQGMVHGASGLARWVVGQIKNIGGSLLGDLGNLLGLGGSGGANPPGAAPGSVQALMQQMAAARGWSGGQWTALYNVEMAEAGFRLDAQNPKSNAYGLAQFINGPSEYYTYGGNPNTASGQITAMLNYILQRYGSPSAAWAHEQAYHWYGDGLKNGLFTKPTLIGVGERGPELVNITPAGGRGYGNTYHLNVSVAPGGEREAGRQMVECIKKFEQGSGKGWRS